MLKYANKSVFFYCAKPRSAQQAAYHHLAVCIAEGLKQLGIKFYSNRNYFRCSPEDEDYLFRFDPQVSPEDCDAVVISLAWFLDRQPFPQHLFSATRSFRTVYLDREDGLKTFANAPKFQQFDFILKTHYSSRHRYPSNFHPWAFGISSRIASALAQFAQPYGDRKSTILLNFRNKRNAHTVRKAIYQHFGKAIATQFQIDNTIDDLTAVPSDPWERLWWYQTGKRHYNSYYKRLASARACACFGGYFVSPWPRNKALNFSRLQERFIAKISISTDEVVQWDSWRLWESLAAGCISFHVDFKKYGLELPVNPVNWQHYIGVDLNRVDDTLERLARDPTQLAEISDRGQQWAFEHYAPLPTAQRFLELVFG